MHGAMVSQHKQLLVWLQDRIQQPVTDGAGCTASGTVDITEPGILIANSVTVNANCDGADGTISITASSGNGGYQYSLDGVQFQTFEYVQYGTGQSRSYCERQSGVHDNI
jgi:hypothetical protein